MSQANPEQSFFHKLIHTVSEGTRTKIRAYRERIGEEAAGQKVAEFIHEGYTSLLIEHLAVLLDEKGEGWAREQLIDAYQTHADKLSELALKSARRKGYFHNEEFNAYAGWADSEQRTADTLRRESSRPQ